MLASLNEVKVSEFSYKKIETTNNQSFELKLKVYSPGDYCPSSLGLQESKAAVIFFFGGGWRAGKAEQFMPQSVYLASKDFIAITPDYRVSTRHNSTPFDSVKDAKDAVLWVYDHSNELGINPNKIICGGGSAGAHLAACTSILKQIEFDDREIHKIPKGLVLFNPVIDTTENGFGFEHTEGRGMEISPIHHITANLPPAVLFQGEDDTVTPPDRAREFQKLMQENGNTCVLHLYPGEKHGFFNPRGDDYTICMDTIQKAESFIKTKCLG
jgi:acetyl esterase/lipase